MVERLAEIPRKTCRLFGAIKAASNIRHCAVLVHGPRGCVYHINYILGMRGDRPSQVYSTCLDERDVIFGAEQKLRHAIEELDTTLRPELIVVLSCCASGIIGEDLAGAIQGAPTNAKIIAIEAGGFEGDFRTGYSETLKRLVEELVSPIPAQVNPRSLNLIGLLRGGPDLYELRHLLGLIDVQIGGVLTADATLAQIEGLGKAALNIVVCEPAGRESAELLEKQYGTPFIIEEPPIGYAASLDFLERVGYRLGIPVNKETIYGRSPRIEGSLEDRRIAIVGGPTRAVSVTRFLAELGGMPRLIVLDYDGGASEKLRPFIGPECEVIVEPSFDLIVQKLGECEIDLIIGGMLERPLATAFGIEHLDIMHGSQKTVGFSGAANLIRLLRQRPGPQ